MSDFIISTDSTADLPAEYVKENNIILQNLHFSFGDENYSGFEMEPKLFFDRMRNGEMPTTNATIPGEMRASFEEYLSKGFDILHLSFSSGLSASYSVAVMVAEELRDLYPDRKIIVIDSLCASLGQGLFVYRAVQKKAQGEDIDSIATWLVEHRLNFCHYFTVDDLFHLHRGGRVSKATAVVGTMLSVKPILHVDDEGHLINVDKVRGRKASLNKLVDNMADLIDGVENDIVYIAHGDCEEDAQYVADRVKERFGIQNVVINYLCPTIGAHTGPGLVALFFEGRHR